MRAGIHVAIATTVWAGMGLLACNAIDGLSDVPPVTGTTEGGADAHKHPPSEAGGKDGGKKDGGHDGSLPMADATTDGTTADGPGHESSTEAGPVDSTAPRDAPADSPVKSMDASDAPIFTVAPRQISPLSTSRVTSRSPTLTWQLPAGMPAVTGATIDICPDRTCASPTISVYAAGSSYKVPATGALLPGVHFWRLHPMMNTSVSSPTWEFTVGVLSAPVDTSWGTTLDVNGDGCADIAIGANDSILSGPGNVYVFEGNQIPPTAPTYALPGTTSSSFGQSVASAGDVNGDGYADLVVGAPQVSSATGAVYIFLGGPTGLALTAAVVLTGPDGSGGDFGNSVASAGDVNGDGYADIVVGAPGWDMFTGKAYVYFGGPNLGTGTAPLPGPVLVGTAGTYDAFGLSVAGAGDVNGDGFGDIIVGADEGPDGAYTGSAFIYLGGPAFVDGGAPSGTTLAGKANSIFGYSVAGAGDINGDGYADIIVGGYGINPLPGAASIYYGSAGGISGLPVVLTGPNADAQFGVSVAGAGDVNGDGYADIVVGADGAKNGTMIYGGVYIYLGGASGLTTTPASNPDPYPPSLATSTNFGSAVASCGNFSCGSYAGIIVGAPDSNGSHGSTYYFLGGSSGVNYNPSGSFNAPTGGGSFGNTVFGATN